MRPERVFEKTYLLYPKPRDFVAAKYRLVSTWECQPTEDDPYFTISRGIPGSAMPSWSHLSDFSCFVPNIGRL